MEIDHADVEPAFLNPDLIEEIYAILPDGTIVRLLKALYGLKQAPRIWYQKINGILKNFASEIVVRKVTSLVSNDRKLSVFDSRVYLLRLIQFS